MLSASKMLQFWNMNFSTAAMNIFFVASILAPTHGLTIKKIKGIDGFICDLQFDSNSNAYGVANQYKIIKEPCHPGPCCKKGINRTRCVDSKTRYAPTVYYLFKVDANQTVTWKTEFRPYGWLHRPPSYNVAPNGTLTRFEEESLVSAREDWKVGPPLRLKILINNRNDVYLVANTNDEHRDIYKILIWKGNPILKKISEFASQEPDPNFELIFLVDNKIITVDSTSYDAPGNAEKLFQWKEYRSKKFLIKVLNTESGEHFIVATSTMKKPLIVKDKKYDIYFTITNDVCFKLARPCKEELVALTRNSLQKENPRLKRILEVDPDNADIIDLRLGARNELYVGIYDTKSSVLNVQKFFNRKLATIFKQAVTPHVRYPVTLPLGLGQPSYISLLPVRSGVVIKTCSSSYLSLLEKSFKGEFHSNHSLFLSDQRLEMHFMILDANNSVVPLRDYNYTPNQKQVEALGFDFCYQNEALEDKKGNIFFEGTGFSDIWDDETRLLVFNRTTGDTIKIKFHPGYDDTFRDAPFYETDFLLDARENLWFLSSYFKQRYFGESTELDDDPSSYLYFLKKGSFVAKQIPNKENVTKIIKGREGQIFILSHSGLFVSSIR